MEHRRSGCGRAAQNEQCHTQCNQSASSSSSLTVACSGCVASAREGRLLRGRGFVLFLPLFFLNSEQHPWSRNLIFLHSGCRDDGDGDDATGNVLIWRTCNRLALHPLCGHTRIKHGCGGARALVSSLAAFLSTSMQTLSHISLPNRCDTFSSSAIVDINSCTRRYRCRCLPGRGGAGQYAPCFRPWQQGLRIELSGLGGSDDGLHRAHPAPSPHAAGERSSLKVEKCCFS